MRRRSRRKRFRLHPGGKRQVSCESCGESFAVEDGPVCPRCGHDHEEEDEGL